MNAMKKVIMLLIGAALVLSFAGAGAAADIIDDGDSTTTKQQDVPVLMSAAQGTYLLSLPATITVNKDGTVNSDAEYKLIVDGTTYYDGGKTISVSVDSTKKDSDNAFILNATDNNWEFVNFGIYITDDSNEGTDINNMENYVKEAYSGGFTFLDKVYTDKSGKICTVLSEPLASANYFRNYEGGLTFYLKVNEPEVQTE